MWAALMFHYLWGESHKDSVHKAQLLKGKESRGGESNPSRPLTTLTPNRQTKLAHEAGTAAMGSPFKPAKEKRKKEKKYVPTLKSTADSQPPKS